MKDIFRDISDSTKHVIDVASVATVLGTLVEMLPSIAALFTIVWTVIRIYETDTVQGLLGKKNAEQE